MEASKDLRDTGKNAGGSSAAKSLSIANWSPSNGRANGGHSNQKDHANNRASSTDISTESDSEKDAAEAFSSAKHVPTGKIRS